MKFKTNLYVKTDSVPERNLNLLTKDKLYRVYGNLNKDLSIQYYIIGDRNEKVSIFLARDSFLDGLPWEVFVKFEDRRKGD